MRRTRLRRATDTPRYATKAEVIERQPFSGGETMNRGDAMLKVVEEVFADGKDLVRGWRLLEHARDSLKRGGPDELKRYYERCLRNPRGERMHGIPTRKGRKTLESEYPRFLAAYNSRAGS